MDVCNALAGWPAKQEAPFFGQDYIALNILINTNRTGLIALGSFSGKTDRISFVVQFVSDTIC